MRRLIAFLLGGILLLGCVGCTKQIEFNWPVVVTDTPSPTPTCTCGCH